MTFVAPYPAWGANAPLETAAIGEAIMRERAEQFSQSALPHVVLDKVEICSLAARGVLFGLTLWLGYAIIGGALG